MYCKKSVVTGLLLLFIFSFTSMVLGADTPIKTSITIVPIDEVYCDVLVTGAGAAGIPAAVQSARAGARTILVEMAGQCGGTTTLAGIKYPGLFHAWGKQVIAGIGWELVKKAVELNGDTMPDFSVDHGIHHWMLSIPVNVPLYALLAEELCLDSGVQIRYYESPCFLERIEQKEKIGDQWRIHHWKVTTCSQGKFRTIYCSQLIDCTGNGTVADMAGAERFRAAECQPGSIFYTINHNIDEKKANRQVIHTMYNKAIAEKRLRREDMTDGPERILWRPRPAGNRTYVYGADNSTPVSKTDSIIRGRQSALRVLRFVRTLPGGENAQLQEIAQETGIRETWRIKGRYIITAEDYRTGRVWPDSVAYAFYPIDIHTRTGVTPKKLENGVVPTIPYRALLADGVDNLLFAGRCISADREAASGLRVQSACMAGGQAAGAGAALAAKNNVSPDKVDIQLLKELLKQQGSIIPEFIQME